MKVEDCIVAVERRRLGGCIDLAFVFVRTYALPIGILTLTFAVPCCLLTWLLAEVQQLLGVARLQHPRRMLPSCLMVAAC